MGGKWTFNGLHSGAAKERWDALLGGAWGSVRAEQGSRWVGNPDCTPGLPFIPFTGGE